jgi:hypothetical protein
MSVYRITEFTSSDMGKAAEMAETMRDVVAAADAVTIDIISIGDGKGLVVAKYDTQAKMEAATAVHKQVFGSMIESGVINGDGISMQSGEVVVSF